MLSRDLLHALLQGLPERYVQHLDPPWPLIARRILLARNEGLDPLSALRAAFANFGSYERATVKEALLIALSVARLPGLSYRQREALIALRTSKVASLSQLSRILAQDRSNTFRRMAALIAKGYVLKFFQPGGVFYFAIPEEVETTIKAEVNEFLSELTEEFSAEPVTKPTTPPTYTRIDNSY